MKSLYITILSFFIFNAASAQSAEEAISKVKARLEKVTDYQAVGKMKTNVIFIKAPIANIKVYYKKPDKLRINNEQGISFVPKGSVNINLNNVFLNTEGFDIIDMGKEVKSGFRVIKLLPRDENSDVVLSTLHIDEINGLVMRARTTTRDNGTYELQMSYGKYAEFGLADKVILEFNTKEYKLPKGVTFDYDDGSKKQPADKMNNKKGKVEIVYTSYTINKGVPDTVFK